MANFRHIPQLEKVSLIRFSDTVFCAKRARRKEWKKVNFTLNSAVWHFFSVLYKNGLREGRREPKIAARCEIKNAYFEPYTMWFYNSAHRNAAGKIFQNSPPVPELPLVWMVFHVTFWVVISPDVSEPDVETLIREYVSEAPGWSIHDPVCRVRENAVL